MPSGNSIKALALTALALAGSMSAIAAAAPVFTPYVGGSPTFGERSAIINGKKVTLVAIASFLHDMDLPPGGVQEFSDDVRYFTKDLAGNMAHCEKWIKQIKADEAAWTKQKPTYPYLEINVASNAKPLTWNGIQVYQGADVRCWEVMDFGAPDY